LKKNLLATIGLLFLFNLGLLAADRFWVNGSGSWNDPSHWAAVSGGAGGASVPLSLDNVFFDYNSVGDAALSISINGTAKCKDLIFSGELGTTVLNGPINAHLEIFGSLAFSEYFHNQFLGEITFKSTGSASIDFKTAMPKGNIRFAGAGHSIWNLNSDLILSFNSKIIIEQGRLNANHKNIQAFGIQWSGTASKILDISGSKMVVAQMPDETGTANSLVIKNNTFVYPRSSGGSRTVDSVQTAVVAPLCNTSSDGSITVTVFSSTSTGPFVITWTGGCCSGGCTGNPLLGICNGSYLLTVTDQSDGEQLQQFVQVIAPNPIGANFVKVRPTCFGDCNGSMTANVVVGSGTAPYTYSWNTVPPQLTPTASNLCAGTYILTVRDANNCTQNFTQILTQPAVVAANASGTNLTCNGVCNGTATSAATGGNAPFNYTYSWTSSVASFTPQSSQSISGLCAGTYSVTVRDDQMCSGTGTTIITEPPPLVITPASTNISCNGACDGTAGVGTVTGGVPPYTYTWNPATVFGPNLTNLCPGTYSVVVADQNGCTQTASFTITEPAPFTVAVTGVNENCFGGNTGSVTATVAGGTGPFDYAWTPGTTTLNSALTTNTLSSQFAGTYDVTVTDANGCTATGSFTITEPPLLVANAVETNITCFGLCNGSVTSTPTGGTPPYSYAWTPNSPPLTGQGTSTITNLCPNTYSVTVTDFLGCTSTQVVTITQPPQITLSVTKTDVQCNGACDGTASATVGGGTPGYTFLWAPGNPTGQGTANVTGLCPGTYTVTVSDANLCTRTQTITITQPNVLNATLTATSLLCNADCSTTITSTVSGGTPGYTFSWAPGGQTTPSITNQCAGTYTLTVTDANGCTRVVTIVVSQPTPLVIIPSSTNVTCAGLCTGSATVIAGGGTPAYSYSWAPTAQTTASISSLCAGTYTVTVEDANSCTMTSTVTITEPTLLLSNPSVVSDPLCSGNCNGSVTGAPSGGTPPYTTNWLPGAYAGEPGLTITGLCAGTYTLVTTDANSCSSNQSVTITQPPPLSAPITGSTSSCNVCNGTATVSPTGGTPPYTFVWSDPSAQTTAVATGLCPNVTYTVTITDANGCTASGSVTISQTIQITITTSNTTLSCFGACDGIATANAAGGANPYTFLWLTVPGGVQVPGGTGQTVTGLCAGTYEVIVSDANGCLNRDSITFTNPPDITVTSSQNNASCGGVCDGTATINALGGTGAYTYSWNTSPVQNTQNATGLCAGSYTGTVTDAMGCSDSVVVTITEQMIVVDNPIISDANCLQSDGSITVAPTGGNGTYSYFWGPGVITGQGTATATNLPTGNYTLTITTGSCTYNFNYLISNINGPTLSMVHTDVTCNGDCNGTATVTASGGAGGFVYDWSPANPSGDGTPAVTALCGGITYSLSVTDAAGCITLDTVTIIDPAPVSPNPVVVNESCGGSCNGSITLNPSGGVGPYAFLWTGGGQTTPSLTGLCAGAYTVTVTDANGCDSTLVINITSPPLLTVAVTPTNVQCANACNGEALAVASGGSGGGYTYVWPNLPPSNILAQVVNLCPGPQIVIVTDGNNCTATDTVDIIEPPLLTTTTSQVNSSCNASCDGIAVVTAAGGTPGYNYTWTGAAGIPDNDTASALCPASYNVTVTDANGCTSSPLPIVITDPAGISPGVTFTNPLCNGSATGTATSNATGGTLPYTYDWNPGTPPGDGSASVTGLVAGPYSLTITDAMGCSNTQNFTLINPSILNANPSSTSPLCVNSCNGSATATPIGGTAGGYSFSWSPGGAITQTATGLCPNVYTVIVADINGCRDTASIAVVNPAGIDVAVSSTPSSCGVCDGTISLTPLTGIPSYSYLWSPAPTIGQGTANASSVCADLYNVTVTDGNGCDSTFAIALSDAGGVTSEIVTENDATCNGLCNGSGSLIPVGGTPPFIYEWTDSVPTMNDSAFNLCAGVYFVEIIDSNSCVHFSQVNINEPAPIQTAAAITNAVCSNVCTGVISLTTSGGTGAYNYLWAPGNPVGQGTSTITGLCPGTYTVTITDINSCTLTSTFTIIQSTPLTAAIGATNISCSSVCSGVASVNVLTGTAPYLFQWNDPSGQVNDTATSLCAGSYTVSITDSMGCIITLDTTITATPAVNANAAITNAACGLCDGSAILAPTGGTAPYSYLWSNGDTGTSSSNLCAGLYSVNITDASGCTNNYSIPVSNTGGPTSVTITSTNITCGGSCNGSVTGATPVGGTAPYSYLWLGAGGQTTPTISGLCSGVHYLEVTDSNNCSVIDSVTITQPTPINANQLITAATCGVSNGAVTLSPSGGTGSYTYVWSNGLPATASQSGLAAGVYSVQISDGAGCMINVVITINNQNAPSLTTSVTNVTCEGLCNGTATVIATGGAAPYQYTWNDVLTQITPTADSLCAGAYAVEVEGTDGCIAVTNVIITEPSAISFSAANTINPLCGGDSTGMITVIPSGGTLPYTYNWMPGNTTGDTLFNVPANTYVVTLTDGNGCLDSQTVVITEPTPLVISNTFTSPTCNNAINGTIDITISGGALPYTFAWIGSTATTEDLTGLAPGIYIVNVTDANGCTIADTIDLLPVQSITVFAGNDTTFCQNTSVTLNAVSATAVSYQWFEVSGPLLGTSSSLTLTPPIGISSYYVIVDNGSGCQDNDTITINSPSAISINAVITNAACNMCDGLAILAPTGGTPPYTYLWSNGDAGTTATNLCAGLYNVNLTDSAGCSTTFAVPVSNTSGPTSLAFTSTNIGCNGGTTGAVTSVTPTGGIAPYSYFWITGQQTTQTLSGLDAGVYFVQVTDSSGCSIVDSVTITEVLPIQTNPVITAPGCGVSNGAITLNPTGGTGPYSYVWSGGLPASASQTNLGAGIYTVTITDNGTGCSLPVVIPLSSQNAPALTMSSTNLSCNGICNGTATVVATGTAAPYSFVWNDPASQNTATATGLCEGTYAVTATGTNGCIAAGMITLTEPPAIDFSVASTSEPLCNGDANGMITVIPSGGTLPYTYNWSPVGGTGDTLVNVGANSYTVVITDANGCLDSQTVFITEPPVLSISNVTTNPSCNTISDGAVNVTVTGGTQPYSFVWSGGSTAVTEDLTGLSSGSFTVNVTDGNGCTVVDSTVLIPVQTINVFAGNDTTFCESGQLTLTALSATAITYEWFALPSNTLIDSVSSITFTPSSGITSYYVQVNNGTGCSNADTITISSNPVPFANAGSDVTIITGSNTVIGGSPTGTSGASVLWSPLPGLDNATSSNPVAAPSTTTTYTVVVTTPEGCSASDSVIITVLPTIVIPDGISPNADGDNDEWIIDGIELFPNCNVEVYNRWGELLFQSPGYKEKWKGTFKGKDLPVGTYYYIIDLKDPLFPDAYTGPITILR
jgi:gliding motility-associated-like protein